MRFSLEMILEYLKERFPGAGSYQNKSFMPGRCAKLTGADQPAADETLFLSSDGDVPDAVSTENLCFAFVGKPACPEKYGACLWVDPEVSADTLSQTLYDFFAHASFYESRLLTTAVMGGTPQEMLDSCIDYFEDSYFSVYDSSYKIIAQADSRIFQEREARHTFIGQEVFLNYWQVDNTLLPSDAGYGLGFEHMLRHSSRIIDNPGGVGRVISCGVSHSGIWFARIFVEGKRAPVKLRYLPMVDLFAKCLINYFSSTAPEDSVLQASSNAIFRDILSGISLDPALVEHHISALGWKLDDKFKLYIIENPEAAPLEEPGGRAVLYQLAQLFSYMRIISLSNTVSLIYRVKDRVMPYEEERDLLLNFLKRNNLKCAESSVFSDFTLLSDLFLQANKLFSYERRFKNTSRLIEISKYISYDMVSNYMLSKKPEAYLHPAAVALHDYDLKNNSSLVEALYRYLLNDRSHTRCADKMFIHRRTFQYRLQKIFDIIDVDLNDDITRINLINSLLFYLVNNKDDQNNI